MWKFRGLDSRNGQHNGCKDDRSYQITKPISNTVISKPPSLPEWWLFCDFFDILVVLDRGSRIVLRVAFCDTLCGIIALFICWSFSTWSSCNDFAEVLHLGCCFWESSDFFFT